MGKPYLLIGLSVTEEHVLGKSHPHPNGHCFIFYRKTERPGKKLDVQLGDQDVLGEAEGLNKPLLTNFCLFAFSVTAKFTKDVSFLCHFVDIMCQNFEKSQGCEYFWTAL